MTRAPKTLSPTRLVLLRLPALVGAAVVLDHSGASVRCLAACRILLEEHEAPSSRPTKHQREVIGKWSPGPSKAADTCMRVHAHAGAADARSNLNPPAPPMELPRFQKVIGGS